ncbi:MAG: HAD-IC family P-type ATPase, partial [Hungatella sp.]
LQLAAYAEFHSTHPIALSVKDAYGKEVDPTSLESVEEIAGHGIHAVIKIDGILRDLFIGNEKLMIQQKIALPEQNIQIGTILYLAEEADYLGYIVIADTIRADVPKALAGLRAEGVRKLIMLTGDKEAVGKAVAEKLELDQSFGGLLPADKVHKVEELLQEKSSGKTLAFVGDGINDAPVLARADVGIAMGGIGSDAAVEAADVVIMTDEPSKLVDAIQIARKT